MIIKHTRNLFKLKIKEKNFPVSGEDIYRNIVYENIPKLEKREINTGICKHLLEENKGN